MGDKNRYYTIKCPLSLITKDNLKGRDVGKKIEISIITTRERDEDEVVRDVLRGLGKYNYTEDEQAFLVQLENDLWKAVECLENLKTCILTEEK